MSELEQALANQIGKIDNEDCLLKALCYLLLYSIQNKKTEETEKEKQSLPLKDSYEGLWRKRPIPKLIPFVS